MTDTAQKELIADAVGAVTGIALPKDKPQSPMRQVTFEPPEGWTRQYPPSGWMFADKLGDISIGDVVAYKVEKVGEYKNVTHIARAGSEGTSAPGESQRDHEAPPPRSPDDAERGEVDRGRGDSPTAALRSPPPDGVPNTDTRRFESYAFLAACGMVDLAYEELSDAKNAGKVDGVTRSRIDAVAGALVAAADAAQRNLTGHVHRGEMSHTRARGAVRTVLRSYPVADWLEDLDAWRDTLTKGANSLLGSAATL